MSENCLSSPIAAPNFVPSAVCQEWHPGSKTTDRAFWPVLVFVQPSQMLSDAQLRRIEGHFPRSHGVPRVDDGRIVSGIIVVIRNGLRWRDARRGIRPPQDDLQPLHPLEPSRFGGKSGGKPDQLTVDVTHLMAHRTAASPFKRAVPRRIGRTKRGLIPAR